MRKIAVLGSNGMLGRAIAASRFEGFQILEINRIGKPVISSNCYAQISSNPSSLEGIIDWDEIDFVLNCVGLIRQKMNQANLSSISSAIQANVEIPIKLIALSEQHDFKIIQIGTDCVYSGRQGDYIESDIHDPTDVYGKTKSLGEIRHDNLCILRASIVGHEANSSNSLLNWFLSQKTGATINGFNDQLWNGLTVFHFAKLAAAIIENERFDMFKGVHHVVPADKVTKESLLRHFASSFNRNDVEIRSVSSGRNLNLTLGTEYPELNKVLWDMGGYEKPPTVENMILEYSIATQLRG